MEFVLVPAGEFLMGSTDAEKGHGSSEEPAHRVSIPAPFYLGKYEVTQAQWKAYRGSAPSEVRGERRPVESVSWTDCREFLRAMNADLGLGEGKPSLRLPSEAEWEYACRAGSGLAFAFGDEEERLPEAAWFVRNSGGDPNPVGLKVPNAWGLHDAHGNVWEWCEDVYHPSYENAPGDGSPWLAGGMKTVRSVRGGACGSPASGCRCASRWFQGEGTAARDKGFRILLEIPK
jgi:formylglycine-generating enzyme required for sulfatase activity